RNPDHVTGRDHGEFSPSAGPGGLDSLTDIVMDGRCGRGPARRTASAAQYGAGEVDIDVSPACRSGPDRRSGPYPRLDPRAAGSGHLRGARDAAWTDGLRRSPPRARPALRRRLAGPGDDVPRQRASG